MFRSTPRNLRTWWADFSDDILGADLPIEAEEDGLDYHLNHPHRRTLEPRRPRRPGTVTPRPAHCLSPVRGQDRSTSTRTVAH